MLRPGQKHAADARQDRLHRRHLCEDGWFEVYDRRPTTNGQGPPGCPGYTSFVFLLNCASSPEEAQRQQAAVDAGATASQLAPPSSTAGGGSINALSRAFFGSGGMPSARDLAKAGGAWTAVLATFGALALRGSGGAASDRRTRDLIGLLKTNERAFEEAQRALEKARAEEEVLRRRRDEVRNLLERIRKQKEQVRQSVVRSLPLYEHNLQNARLSDDLMWSSRALLVVAGVLLAFAPAAAGASAPLSGLGSAERLAPALGRDLAKIWRFIRDMAIVSSGGVDAATCYWDYSGTIAWQRLRDLATDSLLNTDRLQTAAEEAADNAEKAYEAGQSRVKAALENVERIKAEGSRLSQEISSI